MNKVFVTTSGLVAAAALALSVGFAASAQAQGPGPTPQARGAGMGQIDHAGVSGMRMGGPQTSLITVAADKLGMTQADVVAQLSANKTIADLAAEKNVALDVIVDAFLAPRVTQLNAAVAAGTLTQAQADAMLAAMRANITPRLSQPWTARGPGARGQGARGQGDGTPGGAFVDANGDGVCDEMPEGGRGGMRGRMTNQGAPGFQRGPRR